MATTQLRSIEMSAMTPGVQAVRPLFTVGGLSSSSSGVAHAMRDLATALGKIGVPVSICTAQVQSRESLAEFFGAMRWHAVAGSFGRVSWSPQLRRVLEQEMRAVDIVHNHSVWTLPNSYASRIAK